MCLLFNARRHGRGQVYINKLTVPHSNHQTKPNLTSKQISEQISTKKCTHSSHLQSKIRTVPSCAEALVLEAHVIRQDLLEITNSVGILMASEDNSAPVVRGGTGTGGSCKFPTSLQANSIIGILMASEEMNGPVVEGGTGTGGSCKSQTYGSN